jgi:hypothetical protein
MDENNLVKAEEVYFEFMGITEYPKHKVILNSIDIVQMIAIGIERTQVSIEALRSEK